MGAFYIWLEVFGIYCRLFYTSTLFDDSVDLYQIAGMKKNSNANFYYNLIRSISVRKMLVRI